jgi:hypothetical protein
MARRLEGETRKFVGRKSENNSRKRCRVLGNWILRSIFGSKSERESERKLAKVAKEVHFINSTFLHMVLGLLNQGG